MSDDLPDPLPIEGKSGKVYRFKPQNNWPSLVGYASVLLFLKVDQNGNFNVIRAVQSDDVGSSWHEFESGVTNVWEFWQQTFGCNGVYVYVHPVSDETERKAILKDIEGKHPAAVPEPPLQKK